MISRTPHKRIRQELRREVGFGCPIPGCGNPYLTWHHFDPTWKKLHHENPAGIIALCTEHHNKADAGTWTVAQLREFKRIGRGSRQAVRGNFDWMSDRYLCVLGSNYFLDVEIPFYCSKQPIIWFKRDHDGYLKVNLRRPLTGRTAEWVMQNNDWMVSIDVADIECPPSGRVLAVKYPNKDYLRIEFREYSSAAEAIKQYPDGVMALNSLQFPLVTVDFVVQVPALDINIRSDQMILPGQTTITGFLMENGKVGIAVGEAPSLS